MAKHICFSHTEHLMNLCFYENVTLGVFLYSYYFLDGEHLDRAQRKIAVALYESRRLEMKICTLCVVLNLLVFKL